MLQEMAVWMRDVLVLPQVHHAHPKILLLHRPVISLVLEIVHIAVVTNVPGVVIIHAMIMMEGVAEAILQPKPQPQPQPKPQ
jgi:hypothetical protein